MRIVNKGGVAKKGGAMNNGNGVDAGDVDVGGGKQYLIEPRRILACAYANGGIFHVVREKGSHGKRQLGKNVY